MKKNKLSKDYLNANPELRDTVLLEMESLFEYASPEHVRHTIDELFHMYVIHQHSEGFPVYFDRMATHTFLLKYMLQKFHVLLGPKVENELP